jgi:hypothetical protein
MSRSIDQELAEVYDTPASAATAEVLYGIPMSDELVEEIQRENREGKASGGTKAVKNGLIAATITTPITFIILYMMSSDSPFFIMISVVMTAVIAFVAFIFTLLITQLLEIRGSIKKGRTKDWGLQNAFSNDIQSFLNKCSGYEQVIVRAISPTAGERYGLVILKLKSNMEEETLFSILPQIVQDIHDVELVGPFILSELRRKDIERRYNRFSYGVLGIAIPFLFIGFILSISNHGILGMIDFIIPVFIIYSIISVVPLIGISIWKRNSEIHSDTEIVQTYPRFKEALNTLIANHHTLPYGMTSYRSRLERINKQLGIVHVYDDEYTTDLG